MKKIIFIALAIFTLTATTTKAQTDQGNFLLGASSNYSFSSGEFGGGSGILTLGYTSVNYKSDRDGYTEPDPDKELNLNLIPKVGYFVLDNLAVGVDFVTGYSKYDDGSWDYETSTTLLGFGPFARYYVPSGYVMPFVEIGGAYALAKSKFKDPNGTDDSKNSLMMFGGGAGAAISVGDNAMIDMLLGYNSIVVKATEDNDDNNRIVVGTLGLKIGFTIAF